MQDGRILCKFKDFSSADLIWVGGRLIKLAHRNSLCTRWHNNHLYFGYSSFSNQTVLCLILLQSVNAFPGNQLVTQDIRLRREGFFPATIYFPGYSILEDKRHLFYITCENCWKSWSEKQKYYDLYCFYLEESCNNSEKIKPKTNFHLFLAMSLKYLGVKALFVIIVAA